MPPSSRSHRLSEEEREAIRALADKYDRMRALRAELGRGATTPEHRARLRSLSLDFPGSLRELEVLSTDEIALRLRLSSAIVDEAPAWLVWTAAYHVAMRDALRARHEGDRSPSPHGRLNAKVFATLGARYGVESSVVWDAVFPRRGTAQRSYR